MLEPIIAKGRQLGASDIHLEAGLPLAFRVRGRLNSVGEPVAGGRILSTAKRLLGPDGWQAFLVKRSADLSTSIAGVTCRVNIFQTSRGVGLAIRILAASVPTIASLNLHPDFARLVDRAHGLVLITGATGSGKSSTLAALVQHLNTSQPGHILTLESPIEYQFRPDKAFIRQREVGRDTPSFEQALVDAMREDPDVLVVGEMRDKETMQLTLNAAETGHLVLATMHASSIAEALQRIVAAFPAESQSGVRAQLADSFVAGVSQSLMYHPLHRIRIAECEIVHTNTAIAANIRDGAFFKLRQTMSTGGADGMWTVERYRRWVDQLARVNRPKPASTTTAAPEDTQGTPSVKLPPLGAIAHNGGSMAVAGAGGAGIGSSGAPTIELEDVGALDDVIAELEGR